MEAYEVNITYPMLIPSGRKRECHIEHLVKFTKGNL